MERKCPYGFGTGQKPAEATAESGDGEARAMNPDEPERALRYVFGRGTAYEADTGVAGVLDALRPESDLHTEDHRTFQMVHLVTEMMWYTIHYELRRTVRALRTGRPGDAAKPMRRSLELLDVNYRALQAFIRGISQAEFLELRKSLLPDGSGYDSPGMGNLRRLARALWTALTSALEAEGLSPEQLAQMRSSGARLPGSTPLLADVFDLMLQIDSEQMAWKQLHLRLVWNILGGMPGNVTTEEEHGPKSLKGRPVSGLLKTAVQPFFPDAWLVTDAVYQQAKNGK